MSSRDGEYSSMGKCTVSMDKGRTSAPVYVPPTPRLTGESALPELKLGFQMKWSCN